MKKIVTLLLVAALCLSFAACAAKDAPDGTGEPESAPSQPAAPVEPAPAAQPVPAEEPEPETIWTIPEGVTISLLQTDHPVGAERVTLVIDNPTDLKLEYGEQFSVQKYINGAWHTIHFRADAVTYDLLYLVQPHSARAMNINLNLLAHPLDKGLYRIAGENLTVSEDRVESPSWHIDFRVTADAQPEPDYALYISSQPIPTVEGCSVTDRLPVYFINTTGEDGYVLDIPHLERQNDAGEWESVPWKEGIGFCGTPSTLPAQGRDWAEGISMLWGGLEDGTYRLSYEVGPTFETEDTAYGEFTLYTPEDSHGLPLAEDLQPED